MPNPIWANDSDGNNNESVKSTVTDVFGNTYIAGIFSGDSISVGGTVLHVAGNVDAYISKFDASGTALWTKGIQGFFWETIDAIATDLNGNLFVSGNVSYYDTIDLGGGFLITDDCVFILKLDPNGNPLSLIQAADDVFVKAFSIDASNNLYVTGSYYDSVKFGSQVAFNDDVSNRDIFVAKFDPSGNIVWLKSAGGVGLGDNTDEAYDITTDQNGNVYISGWALSGGFIYFGTLTTGSGGFLAKYDSIGNEIWVRSKQYGYPFYIEVDETGNIYAAGWFVQNSIVYGSFVLTNNGTGSTRDCIIVKYDPAGNVLWAKNPGGNQSDEIMGMAMDANYNIYLAGYFDSPLLYMIGGPTIPNSGTSGDIVLIKMDSLGNYIWVDSYGGAGSDQATNVDLDQNGFVVMAGVFTGPSLIFATDTLTNTGTAGTTDFFLTKLSSTFVSDVWPGDANHDFTVSNNDLLPIGLHYGQTGFPRGIVSNVWQADSSADWGIYQSNLSDIKHADCNGDGIINMSDTSAVNLNYSNAHSMQPMDADLRMAVPEMNIVIPSASFTVGQTVTAELWLGSASNPVTGLYGLSFEISYEPALMEPGTENINYINSWFGNPGTDAIKISKFDLPAGELHGAETRIDHLNANGYGKIADLTFDVGSLASTGFYSFSISNYQAVDSAGNSIFFNVNTIPDSMLVFTSGAGVSDMSNENQILVYPNPSKGKFVFSNLDKETTIEILDVTGRIIDKTVTSESRFEADLSGTAKGIYFYRVSNNQNNIHQGKIILQ